MHFSIVIPVYKVEKYLQECVDSVLAQTLRDIEVILVDDGSPDNCPSICDDYARKDNRVKVIHKPNGGLSDARNFGLAQATGDYVQFLDSDDYLISKTFFEEIKSVLDKEEKDLVIFGRVPFFDGGEIPQIGQGCFSAINGMPKLEALEWLIKNDIFTINACNKIIRRSVLTDNGIMFEKGRLSEDFDWTMQLIMAANSICGYDKKVYAYRRHPGSITQTFSAKHMDDLLTVVERWSRKLTDNTGIDDRIKYALLSYCNYQYCILLGKCRQLRKEDQDKFKERLGSLSFLSDYQLSSKTKIARVLRKVGGEQMMSLAFSLYLMIRGK